MKFKLILIIAVSCFLATLYSCSKKHAVENSGLLGRWQLIQTYEGYVNGGDFSWHSVSLYNAHTLEFTATGDYVKQENLNGNFQRCLGTYQLLSGNNLEVISSCQTITERIKISELDNQHLVIDYPAIEGTVRYKYRVKK